MTDDICDDLAKRYENLITDRTVAQLEWEKIERYVTPYRGKFFKDEKNESSIEWSRTDVYDSTAPSAHQNLAARLHGTISNPSIRWFEIRYRDDDLNKNKEVAKWLSDANERVYYALQDSNFNLEINETYQDICGFGTSAMFLESGGDDPLIFKSIPLKEMCFESDWRGTVLRFYRLLEMTPAQILSQFGAKNVPDNIVEMDKEGQQEKQDVLFSVYPRNNKIVPVGKMQRSDRRPWAYCYFLKDTREMLGDEGGYYEMPVFVPRWRKTNSSIWGNSPAHLAMGDIMSLNKAREMQLKASEKAIDPPLFAEERAIIADLDLSAASLNVVRKLDGIKAFDSKFDIYVSDHMIDQLQNSVRDYFFYDQLMLPAPQGTPATAYEISVRYEQLQKLLGPTLGRLQNDLLDPVVSRTFRVLARAGQIPPPPQAVIDAGAELEVEYIGALSNAQKADRAASIERYGVSLANLAPTMPEVLDVVDQEELARHLGRDLGVPPDVMRGEDEIKKLREERAEMQKRAQAAEVATMEADAMTSEAGAVAAMGQGDPTLGAM
ncbi:MAG: hypothetical protein DRQ40_08015 [Gammaproteobacteria bacterium]|nr:MAG: hypothetical protein DRQ40_08015 [Gammaproteobacteria bacterium]